MPSFQPRYRLIASVSFGILIIACIVQLRTFEGQPSIVPNEATAVYKNKDLNWGGILLEYIFPLVSKNGSMSKCPIAEPDQDCMAKARRSFQTINNLGWPLLKTTHSEIILQIERNGDSSSLLEIRLLSPISTGSSNVDLTSSAPLIVWVHGGGFTVGAANDALMVNFVQAFGNDKEKNSLAQNAIWASIEYRLAPDNPYPAAPDDCLQALDYLVNKYEYTDSSTKETRIGLGRGGVHVAGVSAGGTLAAETTLHALKMGIHIDSLFLDEPVFPLINLPENAFLLDSPSYRRMANTRVLPDQWIKWSMAAYAGCRPSEDVTMYHQAPHHASGDTGNAKEKSLPLCSSYTAQQAGQIFGGTMSREEWQNAAAVATGKKKDACQPYLPPVLLVTAKADRFMDGDEAFGKVYAQAGGNVQHIQAAASHALYAVTDRGAFKATVAHWSELISQSNTTRECADTS